ncbi:MAG: glycosyltransferase [Chroococcales cyanobacterium]
MSGVFLGERDNEAMSICATIQTLLPQLKNGDELIVIADNCDDETAAIARQAGATVIERQDREHLGKGYAFDFGIQFKRKHPPDVVVVIDADCCVEFGAIQRIAQEAIATQRPIQATYLMEKPNSPTPKDAIAIFAFRVKNFVRPKGLKEFGYPCLLTGTGMAFPWSVIDSVNWANRSIVEDMKLGLDLAIAGYPPQFCPEARVKGKLPQQQSAIESQRTRWEHGHLQILLNYVPQLLKEAIAQKRFDLMILALDLSIPPLSLLVLIILSFEGISLLAALLGASGLPFLFGAIAASLLFASILLAWAKFGRNDLPLSQLLTVPYLRRVNIHLMESREAIDLDLKRYLRSLKRRWMRAVSLFLFTLGVTAYATTFLEPTYEADGKLLFKSDKKNSLWKRGIKLNHLAPFSATATNSQEINFLAKNASHLKMTKRLTESCFNIGRVGIVAKKLGLIRRK